MIGVRARLALWNVLFVGLTLTAMGLILRSELRANLIAQVDRELTAEAPASAVTWSRAPTAVKDMFVVNKNVKLPDPSPILRKRDVNGKFVQVMQSDSEAIAFEANAPMPRVLPVHREELPLPPGRGAYDPPGFEKAKTGKTVIDNYYDAGRHMRAISVPAYGGGHVVAVIQATRDLTPIDAESRDLDKTLAMLIPLALSVSVVGGSALVFSFMRPLRRITEAANKLEPDLSSSRLPVEGTDEFAELARTFNQALDRTADAFETQRRAMKQLERFTGDAGHELRTPLAAIKGSVSYTLHLRSHEPDLDHSLRIIDRSADRMSRLIGDLLLLARRDGGQQLQMEPSVAVTPLLQEAQEALQIPDDLTVTVSVPLDLTVPGNAEALQRIFMNLLSNAVTYACSKVEVSAETTAAHFLIRFKDDGPGIAREHLVRLGERFYRPEAARSRSQGGTGLGLAIVTSLCQAHGGELSIESTLGEGATATVVLPLIPR